MKRDSKAAAKRRWERMRMREQREFKRWLAVKVGRVQAEAVSAIGQALYELERDSGTRRLGSRVHLAAARRCIRPFIALLGVPYVGSRRALSKLGITVRPSAKKGRTQ